MFLNAWRTLGTLVLKLGRDYVGDSSALELTSCWTCALPGLQSRRQHACQHRTLGSAGTILPGTTRYVLGIHCLEPFCSTSQNPVWICHPSSFRLCPDLTGVSWLVYLSPSVSVVVRWLFLIPLFSVWISQCLTESIWKKKLVLGFFFPRSLSMNRWRHLGKEEKVVEVVFKSESMLWKKQ